MKFLKIKHRLTIYNFIKQGMPAIKVGKDYRFIKSEVVEFFKTRSLRSQQTETAGVVAKPFKLKKP